MKTLGNNKGFTLVEMLVVAPVVILAIGAFLTVVISMTGEVITSRASNTLTFTIQDALARVEEDTKLSAGFLATNNVELEASNGQGFNNDATNFANAGGAGSPSLILNMVATTESPLSSSSQYIFLKDQPNPCISAQNNVPLTYNIVYFVKDNSLWRRVIMPDQYTDTTNYACSDAWQQPSCNPSWLASQGGTTFCETNDVLLVEGVDPSDLSIQYFRGTSTGSAIATASDGSASDQDRAAALIAATTINFSIEASQTVAGREISQSASIRSSRLDANASAVASLTPATIPSSPVISSTTAIGSKAVFSWPVVQGATGYTFQYNINGGAWQTGFTNQNTRTYTVSAPAHEDTVNARVLATNSAGSSGYATNSITTPLWEPLLLENGWNQYASSYSPAMYTKTRTGLVLLKGLIKKTAAPPTLERIATLPEGYRPDSTRLMFGITTNSNATGRIDITTDGQILIAVGSGGWTSLETIRFVPDDDRYTRVAMSPLANGWYNYGGDWGGPSYVQTSDGRVVMQGLVGSGNWANGVQIYDIPDPLLPPLYMHIATRSAGFGYAGIEHRTSTAEGVVAKAVGNTYLALTLNYFPASYTNWTNLSLVNGWGTYGGVFSTPQYTKSTDDTVTLKGLIGGGSTTYDSVITTLPVGHRPAERILFTTVSAGAHVRIDILPTGQVRFMGGSSSWLSLDGITFVAEQ